MGRAARTKRQRRTRPWQTINPWTGEGETFMVSISNAGLREWEDDRVSLAARGYPDRPPLIDTPLLRSWGPIPSQESLSGGLVLGADRTARAVGYWSCIGESELFKANVGRRPDGTYVVHFIVGPHTDPVSFGLVFDCDLVTVRAAVKAVADHFGVPQLGFVSGDALLADLLRAA
jgi:hypothetical protein